MTERALLFVDGNNWYHGLKSAGVADQMRLDWVRMAQRIVGPRQWLGTRYYVGRVEQKGEPSLYANQRRFESLFTKAHANNTMHFGRLEPRFVESEAAHELLEYLANLARSGQRLDPKIGNDLRDIGNRHRKAVVRVEKAVDVMVAVDMVAMACDGSYDTAYLLSADGDYTHAVNFVRGLGKKVFAVSASHGAQLAQVVNSFIRLKPDWFQGLYV